MKNKKLTVILSVVLAVLIAVFAGVYFLTRPETKEGAKDITVTVVYKDKTEKDFQINTDAKYLSDALLEEELIEKEEYDTRSGLYTLVDGVKADYNVDQGWWQVLHNGEKTSVGMDELPVVDGDEFTIAYTIGWE